jgi:uncharacterized damage-inducible protein DinB
MTTTATKSDALVAEVRREAETTRRVLERVPEDKLAWAPHAKSMSLGTLALHVATVPGAIAALVSEPTCEVPTFVRPEATSRAQLLSALDGSIAAATQKLAGWEDDYMGAEWKMTSNGATLLALPRIEMIRSVMLNHWYHHRGQLTVYLRLLDVPGPSVYGPSADESPFG